MNVSPQGVVVATIGIVILLAFEAAPIRTLATTVSPSPTPPARMAKQHVRLQIVGSASMSSQQYYKTGVTRTAQSMASASIGLRAAMDGKRIKSDLLIPAYMNASGARVSPPLLFLRSPQGELAIGSLFAQDYDSGDVIPTFGVSLTAPIAGGTRRLAYGYLQAPAGDFRVLSYSRIRQTASAVTATTGYIASGTSARPLLGITVRDRVTLDSSSDEYEAAVQYGGMQPAYHLRALVAAMRGQNSSLTADLGMESEGYQRLSESGDQERSHLAFSYTTGAIDRLQVTSEGGIATGDGIAQSREAIALRRQLGSHVLVDTSISRQSFREHGVSSAVTSIGSAVRIGAGPWSFNAELGRDAGGASIVDIRKFFSWSASRRTGTFSMSLLGSTQSEQSGIFPSQSSQYTVTFEKVWGRVVGSLSSNETSSVASATRTESSAVRVGLHYRIFEGAYAGVSVDRYRQRATGGTPRTQTVLSFDLGVPLGYDAVSGVSDSRHAGTVDGFVGRSSPRGKAPLPGALITLDGVQSQLTDFNGRFSFYGVASGVHIVSIDYASLPPGVMPDRLSQTVSVRAGQGASVTFVARDHVAVVKALITVRDGEHHEPLPGIGLLLDGKRAGTTDAAGQFVGLIDAAGVHRMEVDEQTIPAFVQISGVREQHFVSEIGSTRELAFTAERLGSIEGRLLIRHSNGDIIPLAGAYIVVAPGNAAVITDQDGSFTIDNLPAGVYRLDVDSDVSDDLTASMPSKTVRLEAGQHLGHLVLTANEGSGPAETTFRKKVEIREGLDVHVLPSRIAPGARAQLAVFAPKGARGITYTYLGVSHAMRFDAHYKAWMSELLSPSDSDGGALPIIVRQSAPYTLHVAATLFVDPSLALVHIVQPDAGLQIGAENDLSALTEFEVEHDDYVLWQDGTKSPLRKSGRRSVRFVVVPTALPFRGILVTKSYQVPIEINTNLNYGGHHE